MRDFEIQCPECGGAAFAVSVPGSIHCPRCGDTGFVFVCERTRRGHPALWEQGGGATNTGEAQIIAGPRGERLKPIYIRTRGHRACGQHALFVVQPQYHIVRVWYWNKQNPPFSVRAYRIENIIEFNKEILAIAFTTEEKTLDAAINAAKQKALCYHCRSPHYALLL